MENPQGRFGRRRRVMADINVTPLVDVMLVLLIVFMVAAPMMTQGLDVDLPEATTRPLPQTDKPLVVSIRRDGAVYLRKEKTTVPDLYKVLQALPEDLKKQPLYLHADKSVPYGQVVETLSAIHRAGFEKPCMVTLPKQGRK